MGQDDQNLVNEEVFRQVLLARYENKPLTITNQAQAKSF
jgi:hypothetical protein